MTRVAKRSGRCMRGPVLPLEYLVLASTVYAAAAGCGVAIDWNGWTVEGFAPGVDLAVAVSTVGAVLVSVSEWRVHRPVRMTETS